MIDPIRGPLVKQALELYSSGNYSFESLAEEMAKRGLTIRGRKRDGSKQREPDRLVRAYDIGQILRTFFTLAGFIRKTRTLMRKPPGY